jgi:lipid II:glycine glycyltransferase (peptidoglycan interpeptide bridge formation enzyme)
VSRPGDLADEKYKGKTHVIKKIKRKITRDQYGREFEEMELEFYDARQTLVDLGRHYKLFTDRLEIDWKVEIIELLKQGAITPQDIMNEFADEPEAAVGLLESFGLSATEIREAEMESEAALNSEGSR